jgi:hypothetical protein
MKKKLLQEQKEKAIIESFAKTFNKIKRLDENPLGKEKDRIEHLAATSSSMMPYLMRELYNKYDADLDAPCVTFSSDAGYQEWDSLEELLNSISDYVVAGDDRKAAEIYKTDMQHLNGTSDTGIKLGLETGMSYKATISWAKSANGMFQGADYIEIYQDTNETPTEQPVDEINLKKGLEENINMHDKYTPLQQIYNAFNKLEKNDFHGWFNTYRNDLLKKEKNLIAVTYNQAFSNGAYDAKGDPSKYEDGEDYYNKNFGQ